MAEPAVDKHKQLSDLIEKISVAIMTSRSSDGSLVSRPMQTQQQDSDSTLWFMTNIQTHKVDDLQADPEVNLSYYDSRSREWVSVSGKATITTDRSRVRELYRKDWKAWFEDEGGDLNGGPDDPRIALIEVRPTHAAYFKSERAAPVVLFEIAKASVSGGTPQLGEVRTLEKREL